MDNLLRLLNIMQMLRDPEEGCAWDIQQSFASIVPYTIEEVYEVAEAIDQEDFGQLKDELGDLLLQIVYYSQMARERNLFDFDDVARSISDKLIRRHPQLFDNQNFHDDQKIGRHRWEQIKQQERDEKAELRSSTPSNSILDDIPATLPQLLRAKKIQKRVASVGFDWQEITDVIDKVEEELAELKQAINTADNYAAQDEELGDLLFSIVNLSRHLNINAEDALRKGNKKFIKRFKYLENKINNEDGVLADYSLHELEIYWQQAKQATRS